MSCPSPIDSLSYFLPQEWRSWSHPQKRSHLLVGDVASAFQGSSDELGVPIH